MVNWREIPLFRILVPFVAGILLAMEMDKGFPGLDILLPVLFILLILLAQAPFNFRFRWIFGALLNLFFLLLAYQLCFYHVDWNRSNHFRQYISSSKNTLTGQVEKVTGKNDKRIKVHLQVNRIDSVTQVTGKVLLSFKNDSLSREINYGDRLLYRSQLRVVSPPKNPEAYDYKKYLHLKNIDYQGFIEDGDWRKLESQAGNPVLHFAFSARNRFLKILEKYLPSENEQAVASALILGYKEDLNQELKSAYANTGAMHVLAVSGLHVGLIWGILAFLLSWVRWRNPAWKWLKTLLIIFALWAFALITGASPSVLRAATMFTFLIIGTNLERTVNIYNTLAASALFLLFYNPFLIREVGFQLSYLAVLGIVYFHPKIYRQWYIQNRLGNFIWQLTAVAIAAQLTTFPLSLFYFHQFPVYFWLSGLIVVPFAFLILGGGILLFFLELIAPVLASYFAFLLHGITWLMNALIFLLEQMPSGLISRVWLSLGVVLLIYLILLGVALAINSKNFKWLLRSGGIAVLVCGVLSYEACQQIQQREIVIYQVFGKTYLECIDGEKAIAFGNFNVPEKTLRFTRDNYHFSKNIETVEQHHFGYEPVKLAHWLQKEGFIQFYHKKLVCLEKLPPGVPEEKIKVDFLLIRKNAKLKIANIIQYFEPGLIVLDGSLSIDELLQYKRECIAANQAYYDVRAEGALIYKIGEE